MSKILWPLATLPVGGAVPVVGWVGVIVICVNVGAVAVVVGGVDVTVTVLV